MKHLERSERGSRPRPKRKSVRVGRTRVGKGIFARLNYPDSALIGEITGQIIDDANYGSEYCFEIGNPPVRTAWKFPFIRKMFFVFYS